ncbi:MAG: FAD-dependent oxidoreductase [Clostridia bacterium]|nr:FAD-dependent oxidoreductase [Clostridia bacterium]
MKEVNTKYLIIGAGISGLMFANVKKDNYLIIEKESEIGGYCRTIYKDGFIWDYAGHFFHFKTEEMKQFFKDNMKNEKLIEQDKNTKIYYKGNLIDYPFQTNIHQLEKQEFIDCLYDLYNKVEKENYDSFLDMLYGKFGKSIVEKFLKPYNEKLYACDLNCLDKEAMGRFFPYANINQIINNMKEGTNNSYNNKFLYPENGAMSFLNNLYNNLDKEKIKLNTEIVSVDYEHKIAVTNNDEIIKYEYLINTSPLNKFLEITHSAEDKKLLDRLSYNKVLVFNLGFEKKSQFDEHWIYFPEKEINFYRVGFYDNILNSDRLSMYIEIGYNKNDKNIDVEEQLKLTIENLEKIGIAKDNKLISYSTILMDPAYVHIQGETNEEVDGWKKEMKEQNVYSIGRYGGWTYCSMEDAMIAAKKLAETI